jgi:DMSO/TMAO reductase YedYZ molybdopterin-dependent catalytic subunit/thiosulfate reductase cytochrome b subunit
VARSGTEIGSSGGPHVKVLTFPIWLRASHFLTIVFISFLVRSGLEILSACPRLYLNDDCRPGSEWLTLSRRQLPRSGLWTSTDMEDKWPSWLALPGSSHIGLGRHWHFVAVIGWILTGVVYVALLFLTDEWRRLVPTSFDIVPQALHDVGQYVTLQPPADGGQYNALQQLSYFSVVFILAPLQIATGAAMSPAIDARFPGFVKLVGGRQRARSMHFVLLALFCVFVAGHTAMVVIHGLGYELSRVVSDAGGERQTEAVAIATVSLLALVVGHVLATRVSLRNPALTRTVTGTIIGAPERLMSRALRPSRRLVTAPRSVYHWINGRPPASMTYQQDAGAFEEWRLEIGGLVANPLSFSLEQLRALPAYGRRSLHHCIQGWSSVADWRGVPMSGLLGLAEPLPAARYAVFWGMDDKAKTDHQGEGFFFEAVPLDIIAAAEGFLAYEMNGVPLPVEHGAPLRLRLENQLGFKMVKWLRRIELVADVQAVGAGGGGWREDHQQFENAVAI